MLVSTIISASALLFATLVLVLYLRKRKVINRRQRQVLFLIGITSLVALSCAFLSGRTHVYSSKEALIEDIIGERNYGTIEGKNSCLFVFADSATGAPDHFVAEKEGESYRYDPDSADQVVSEFWVDRYAVQVIQWAEQQEYYVLLSGAVIEEIAGKMESIAVTDNMDSAFTVLKKSESVNGGLTQTRIIAFAYLEGWNKNTYRLAVQEN